MNKQTVRDIDVAQKKVLVRVDFNVPIEKGAEALSSYDHRLSAGADAARFLRWLAEALENPFLAFLEG